MKITQAIAGMVDHYPSLDLVIDGHPAQVFEPKLTLLKRGIVILLDEESHWAHDLVERLDVDGREVALSGATRNRKVVALVRRFVAGEQGDLLAIATKRK